MECTSTAQRVLHRGDNDIRTMPYHGIISTKQTVDQATTFPDYYCLARRSRAAASLCALASSLLGLGPRADADAGRAPVVDFGAAVPSPSSAASIQLLPASLNRPWLCTLAPALAFAFALAANADAAAVGASLTLSYITSPPIRFPLLGPAAACCCAKASACACRARDMTLSGPEICPLRAFHVSRYDGSGLTASPGGGGGAGGAGGMRRSALMDGWRRRRAWVRVNAFAIVQ